MGDSAFDLPERLSAKAEPALIGADERFFADVTASLEQAVLDVSERLASQLATPARVGPEAMARDEEIERLSGRLGVLRRFGQDMCLGRMVMAGDSDPVYVGRLGLTDAEGRRLLLDWRSPAAEPFFGATHANPMGLTSRRRYRWTFGRITDYWDEVFTPEAYAGHAAALDDQSAFIASLGSSRSPRMRDVLGTIAADQDAIIRAGSPGALVVDGGPGTGKTVVALHRTAFLLYSDPRLGHRRGGVLFVGPHQPYLAYVSDVLPSLGEEGVQTCTVRDLVAEGALATVEPNPEVRRLKSSVDMVKAIESAVRFYEEPPDTGITVSTHWDEVWLSPDDWAEAFDAGRGTPHNEARELVWEELLTIAMSKHEGGVVEEQLRRSLAQDDELVAAFNRAWPLLKATDVVADLWRVPAYLRLCAPWLTPDEVRLLQRDAPDAWTLPDIPLLDAARLRLGDTEASRRRRQEVRADAFARAQMDLVVEELLHADEDGMFAQLRQPGIRDALAGTGSTSSTGGGGLDGPFAHIVVDEAQELTDAEWQMLLVRCPTRSFTIVGDRAQARHGFTETWQHRLHRVGLDRVEIATLSINYRTPSEVMTEAEPVIRSVLPDANVPTSIRNTGEPVRHATAEDLASIIRDWSEQHPEGIACVVGDPGFESTTRVNSLTPQTVQGLEFDLVVIVDPEAFGTGIEGAVDRYVAMTRATQQLVILTSDHHHDTEPT